MTAGVLTRWHRLNARALGLFLAAHMANHAALLAGIEAHLAVMGRLRQAYRLPGLEHGLIALFAVQALLGVALVLRRGRPAGGWAWVQVLSGGALGLFLTQHLVAVVSTRILHPEIDTTSWWAASVVSGLPTALYFFPYYVIGIAALFAHLAAAWRFRDGPERKKRHGAVALFGVLFALAVVASLTRAGAGGLPPAYGAYVAGLTD